MKSQNGFSLVELMVAVSIIAVLSAIAIPTYQNYISSAQQATAGSNLASMRVFLEEYYYRNNTYVAGTYNPTTSTDTLTGVYNWKPDGDGDNFIYDVTACSDTGGSITNCYAISVSDTGGSVLATFNRSPDT